MWLLLFLPPTLPSLFHAFMVDAMNVRCLYNICNCPAEKKLINLWIRLKLAICTAAIYIALCSHSFWVS